MQASLHRIVSLTDCLAIVKIDPVVPDPQLPRSLGPIEHATLQDVVVQRLRDAISAGAFQPGDRLVETELALRLGVSRPLLREAMRRLAAERLVEILPNRGPRIPVLSWQDAEAIYDVRRLLEGEAAASCAARATSDDTARLADALAAFADAVARSDADARIAATSRFYGVMLEACGNPILEELLAGLLARINFLRSRSMSLEGRSRQSLAEMTAIHDGIARHDPDTARAAAERHVNNARDAAAIYYAQEAGA
jgi:DNA-binding GntR family transcriptional regulator